MEGLQLLLVLKLAACTVEGGLQLKQWKAYYYYSSPYCERLTAHTVYMEGFYSSNNGMLTALAYSSYCQLLTANTVETGNPYCAGRLAVLM